MNREYFIYKYTFPNGKIYIGQTYKGSGRYESCSSYYGQLVYNAMKKYPNYKKEIIIDGLAETEVDAYEIYYIDKFNACNKNIGYNRETGGHLNKHHSEETKQYISNLFKGKHHSINTEFKKGCVSIRKGAVLSDTTKEKISKARLSMNIDNNCSIPVICIELNKEFKSASLAAKYVGSIGKTSCGKILECCKGKRNTFYNYHWKYGGDKVWA